MKLPVHDVLPVRDGLLLNVTSLKFELLISPAFLLASGVRLGVCLQIFSAVKGGTEHMSMGNY